jgi:hypothetical protein
MKQKLDTQPKLKQNLLRFETKCALQIYKASIKMRQSMNPSKGLIWFMALCWLHGSVAQGRYDDSDRQQIDDDYKSEIDQEHDDFSYDGMLRGRSTESWSFSRPRGNELSIMAGSYDAQRFRYHQRIQLTSPKKLEKSGLDLWFKRDSLERRREALIEQTLAVGYLWTNAMALYALTDAGHLKAYGDVGMGLYGTWNQTYQWGVQLWSVDHYFNTKTLDEQLHYSQLPRTHLLDIRSNKSQQFSWSLRLENDQRLQLENEALSESYDYRRLTCDFEGTYQRPEGRLKLRYQGLQKEESRASRLDQTLILGLNKTRHLLRLAWLPTRDHQSIDEFVWAHEIVGSDYSGALFETTDLQDVLITDASRQNIHLAWRRYIPFNDHRGIQWGAIGSYTSQHKGNAQEQTLNIKAQTLLSFSDDDGNTFAIDMAWDLDRISRAFPVGKRRFLPWGGGGAQVMLRL